MDRPSELKPCYRSSLVKLALPTGSESKNSHYQYSIFKSVYNAEKIGKNRNGLE